MAWERPCLEVVWVTAPAVSRGSLHPAILRPAVLDIAAAPHRNPLSCASPLRLTASPLRCDPLRCALATAPCAGFTKKQVSEIARSHPLSLMACGLLECDPGRCDRAIKPLLGALEQALGSPDAVIQVHTINMPAGSMLGFLLGCLSGCLHSWQSAISLSAALGCQPW